MLNIIFLKKSAKFFKNLLPKHKQQIQGKLKKMQENPAPHDRFLLKGEEKKNNIGEWILENIELFINLMKLIL